MSYQDPAQFKFAFCLSCVLHLVIVTALGLSWRFEKNTIKEPFAVPIELLSEADLAWPEKPKAPAPVVKPEKPAEVKKETPPEPPKKEVPKPTPDKVPVPKPKKEVKKPPQKAKPKKEVKKPEPKKSAPKKQKKKTLDELLASTQSVGKSGSKKGSRRASQRALALEEMAKKKRLIFSIQQQLMACWHISSENVRNATDIVVAVALRLGEEGYILSARTLRNKSTYTHPHFKEMEQSVHRAFDNPQCKPLHLPKEMYDTWKEVIIRFSPKD